jgi:hypothetical protein
MSVKGIMPALSNTFQQQSKIIAHRRNVASTILLYFALSSNLQPHDCLIGGRMRSKAELLSAEGRRLGILQPPDDPSMQAGLQETMSSTQFPFVQVHDEQTSVNTQGQRTLDYLNICPMENDEEGQKWFLASQLQTPAQLPNTKYKLYLCKFLAISLCFS